MISNEIHIACHNVEHLAVKIREPDYLKFIDSFDIFCFLESFTVANFDFSIHFNDYDVYHSPAIKLSNRGRVSGGVVVVMKKYLAKFVKQVECSFDHMLHFTFSKHLFGTEKDILCSFIYVPPYSSPYYKGKDWTCQLSKLEEFFVQFLESKGDVTHLVFDDLNARIGDWTLSENDQSDFYNGHLFQYGNRTSRDKVSNHFCTNLTSFCNMFNLVPLNGNVTGDKDGHFTFISEQGNSVVDYALVSSDLFVTEQCSFQIVKDRVESKHSPIHFSLPFKRQPKTIENNAQVTIFDQLKWDHEKIDEFISNISNEESKFALENAVTTANTCLLSALNIFNNTIIKAAECMRRTIRLYSGRRGKNRWFDRECSDLKREARRARSKYQNNNNIAFKNILKTDYLSKRNLYSNTIREKNKAYKTNRKDILIKECKGNSKFWSISKQIRCKSKQNPTISMGDWTNHFKSVFGSVDDQSTMNRFDDRNIDDPQSTSIPELDDSISEEEVKVALNALKNNKSAGLDEICSEFLRYAGNVIVPFLVNFFNRLYDTCFFPVNWSRSIVVQENRKNNIILYNVDESKKKGQECEKEDEVLVKEILNFVNPVLDSAPINIEIKRLGRPRDLTKQDTKPRPVKVSFDNVGIPLNLLRKAYRLKDFRLKKIGLSADKTKAQREAEKATRDEYRRRKANNEDVCMYRGKVLTKDERDKIRGDDYSDMPLLEGDEESQNGLNHSGGNHTPPGGSGHDGH